MRQKCHVLSLLPSSRCLSSGHRLGVLETVLIQTMMVFRPLQYCGNFYSTLLRQQYRAEEDASLIQLNYTLNGRDGPWGLEGF